MSMEENKLKIIHKKLKNKNKNVNVIYWVKIILLYY